VDVTNQGALSVEPITASCFRVRLSRDGGAREPALIRYGILKNDWPPVAHEFVDDDQAARIRTADAEITISKADGRIRLNNAAGETLTYETGAPRSQTAEGFSVEYALADGEKLYGLGDETRETIQKRGHLARMWVANVACYVPIPFLMSRRGWAIFVNTTWRHSWDVGHSLPDRLRVFGPQGELDYYLFVGRDLPALLEQYTALAGRPHLLPYWGYGFTFVCNQQANAREMLDDALNMRREGIPCDLIGLEPGWMEKHYDYSVDKKWHPERFYIPYWAQKGPQTFLGALQRLGFKLSLWLCCDYDLSYEEERQARAAGFSKEGWSLRPHEDDFEQDTNFMNPVFMDKVTKKDEPWFEHLKKFVDQGVSAFKMDGAQQVVEHPDRRWGNGMTDEEMHNLYPTLLNKQMHNGFKAHTGRRAMIYSSGGYAGIQQFSATWAGDTGGGPKPLISMLNHGLSGHVNTSCDMDVFTPAGIHFGFLQSWSQVCSWAYWRHPWLLGDKLLPIFKAYAALRYRLLPYIYSQAHIAARTGMPIMRAMPLVFPDDPQSDTLVNQYMLGEAFLTGAFAERFHLPAGAWIDYWSGLRYEGPLDLTLGPGSWPADRGGPLFVRAGAIIPLGPVMDYVGQKAMDALELDIYPEGESWFTLYEDDGISYDYLRGALAKTLIMCTQADGSLKLSVSPRQGTYEGMPAARTYELHMHIPTPRRVLVNGKATKWTYDKKAGALILTIKEDEERAKPVVVACEWAA